MGIMRKKAKCKNMEFAYGDKYLAVLYESLTGGRSEVTIYETSVLLKYMMTNFNSDVEKDEENCENLHTFFIPEYKLV